MRFTQYYTEATNNFTIPVKIKANFKIEGGLDNFKNWKVKVLLANSGGDVDTWESPRYVLISLDSNNIIPVAISDEHQTGYELLYDYYYDKKLIKQERYVSINGNGATYLYGSKHDTDNLKHDAEKIEAFKKWLSYGGKSQPVKSGSGGNYNGDMEDIIERGGNTETIKGQLAKPGKELINRLENLVKEYNRFLSIEKKVRDVKESDVVDFINDALNFLNSFKDFDSPNRDLVSYSKEKNILTSDALDDLIKKMKIAQDKNSYRDTANILFSHSGLKNLLHIKLRTILKNPEDYDIRKWKSIFGDLDLANQQFMRLGEMG